MPTLTAREKQVLDLAGRSYAFEANRERDVWDELGISMVRFHQQVRRLVLTEAGMAYAPLTASRLRRRMAA